MKTKLYNLSELTFQYQQEFKRILRSAKKNGMDGVYKDYKKIKEVCVELSIDVDGLENEILDE
jgi:hypothetical protein